MPCHYRTIFIFHGAPVAHGRLLRRLDSVDAPRNDPKRIVVASEAISTIHYILCNAFFIVWSKLLRYPDFIVTSSQRQKLCTLLWRFFNCKSISLTSVLRWRSGHYNTVTEGYNTLSLTTKQVTFLYNKGVCEIRTVLLFYIEYNHTLESALFHRRIS